jgi:hypothetical protein
MKWLHNECNETLPKLETNRRERVVPVRVNFYCFDVTNKRDPAGFLSSPTAYREIQDSTNVKAMNGKNKGKGNDNTRRQKKIEETPLDKNKTRQGTTKTRHTKIPTSQDKTRQSIRQDTQ